MVLSSRRAIASLRRASNRPCGLLIPSANLPPRPIYLANVLSLQRRHNSDWSDDSEAPPAPPEPKTIISASAKDIQKARLKYGLQPNDPVVPTVDDFLGWQKDDVDNDTEIPPEFYQLPWKQRHALKLPQLPRAPVTSDNMYDKLVMSDVEMESIAEGGRMRDDPKFKSRGFIKLRTEELDTEDVEGMADLTELNHMVGDGRFSEFEILEILNDEKEPANHLELMREMIEETENDLKDDIARLKQHEEATLQEEIKLRLDAGMTPDQAEHDARAIMRLPQKRTPERQSLSRDLSNEAIELTETLWNSELEEMGEKGRNAIMKKLKYEQEWNARPLKPSKEMAQDMFYIPPAKSENEDFADPKIWEWNSTDMSSMAHAELEEHRDARKYARLAMYDMLRLSRFTKPFEVPTATEILRFRYTTYMGVAHPSEKKVVMECCPDDFGLKKVQRDKLIKLCGARYDPTRNILKFSCEMFPHQHQNKRWLSELIDKLVEEAKDDADTFEDVPFDFRHHKFKPQRSFPKEWRMSADKLQMKRLRDWQKHATPEEWERLRAYMHHQIEERKILEEKKQNEMIGGPGEKVDMALMEGTGLERELVGVKI
ncbi:hypothetical protein ABW20_dc0108823 [Dactylellina cionopaga]|nr:hypothetical protein ABW20_dc0108823 [Dactylellina cionopaga]